MSFFESRLTGHGYQKLPSGLIIQWGVAYGEIPKTTIDAEGWYQMRTLFNFPIQFPNACVSLTGSLVDGGRGTQWIMIINTLLNSLTQGELLLQSAYRPTTIPKATFLAIGY
jgi:hypothetical protein